MARFEIGSKGQRLGRSWSPMHAGNTRHGDAHSSVIRVKCLASAQDTSILIFVVPHLWVDMAAIMAQAQILHLDSIPGIEVHRQTVSK